MSRLAIPDPPPGLGLSAYLRDYTDPAPADAFSEFSKAALRIDGVERETLELIRIRNAVVQSCHL
jgi:hypothetical protein